ncbi:expansin [Marchantia polymorpha subsp. ruderalis]|uniref:Expansin n=2 Tax=Marchantia polymorpha TaxID=3197 RepID=A0AAF6B012_MARPO|nr:hypothetical protein MARPO_0050s0033 [Marchantia polymorpha]PTQ38568.1 hypothetical protein MARPO_0050s0033 [Marchantia polymorpha]BBN05346.1 hypothetical protein Mp_3g12280 [Marchantia polymorpha subsp. ruderalis]BBN05347.1 hypothetical protein Mp_3g12280 [Marchantia polymorpha subsp. ruderalis]|eukprot:PTQ38567.1 hypothetical protein MARPO_0050s0033 [Marchantia polymorpha]
MMRRVFRSGNLELLVVCVTGIILQLHNAEAYLSTESSVVSRTTFGDATATFYGGSDASGTQGGSCGYQNPFALGYGIKTAALSNSLLANNMNCGACFEVKCKYDASAYTKKWCYPNSPTIIVTATNQSPPGLNGEHHFDLTEPMFMKIANRIGGRIPIQYRRVRCYKPGGIKFTLTGNPFFNLVLVYNVGGAGNVYGMAIKGSRTDFYPMSRNWGQYWQAFVKLTGQSLTFRVTLGNGKSTTFWNVAPANWQFGQTVAATYNFY